MLVTLCCMRISRDANGRSREVLTLSLGKLRFNSLRAPLVEKNILRQFRVSMPNLQGLFRQSPSDWRSGARLSQWGHPTSLMSSRSDHLSPNAIGPPDSLTLFTRGCLAMAWGRPTATPEPARIRVWSVGLSWTTSTPLATLRPRPAGLTWGGSSIGGGSDVVAPGGGNPRLGPAPVPPWDEGGA